MAEVKDDIQDAIAEVFDTLRDGLFFDTIDALILLKPSTTANEYVEVFTIVDKWFFEYNGFTKAFELKISATSDDLTAAFAVATHVSINGTVYAIREGDTEPPLGTNMFWKLLCERPAKRGVFSELY